MANKNNKGGRPKVHWWIAQEVYVLVDEVERQNKPITRRQAIYKFMEGDKFKNLLTNYHKAITDIEDNHYSKLKNYQERSMHDPDEMRKQMIEDGTPYIEPETGEFFTQDDMDNIKADYEDIKKQLSRIPDPTEPGDTNTGYSDRAYKVMLRLIEAHQKYVDDLKTKGVI